MQLITLFLVGKFHVRSGIANVFIMHMYIACVCVLLFVRDSEIPPTHPARDCFWNNYLHFFLVKKKTQNPWIICKKYQLDIENTPIIKIFQGIPRYFSLGPRKIFREKHRYFRPLKSHVGQTVEIFRVNLWYFSTFSTASKHFGDIPDMMELQAAFGCRKR